MEIEEKSLRELETEKAKDILEQLDKMKVGSEEHSRGIDDVVKLSRAINEDYKVECEMYHQDLKTDSEIKRDEEEIKIKREQITLEKIKHNRIKGDTALLMTGFGAMTIFACHYEQIGGLIPKGLTQFANLIPKLFRI